MADFNASAITEHAWNVASYPGSLGEEEKKSLGTRLAWNAGHHLLFYTLMMVAV